MAFTIVAAWQQAAPFALALRNPLEGARGWSGRSDGWQGEGDGGGAGLGGSARVLAVKVACSLWRSMWRTPRCSAPQVPRWSPCSRGGARRDVEVDGRPASDEVEAEAKGRRRGSGGSMARITAPGPVLRTEATDLNGDGSGAGGARDGEVEAEPGRRSSEIAGRGRAGGE